MGERGKNIEGTPQVIRREDVKLSGDRLGVRELIVEQIAPGVSAARWTGIKPVHIKIVGER
jgi:hypothetical protein